MGGRVLFIDGKEERRWGHFIRKERESLAEWVTAHKWDPSWFVTYWPEEDEDLKDELDHVCEFLLDLGDVAMDEGRHWPLTIAVDEFFTFRGESPSSIISPKFAKLVRHRGKYGWRVMLIGHRPTDIPPNYLFGVSHWYAFSLKRGDDLKRISRELDAPPSTELIAKLDYHQYAAWVEDGDFMFFNAAGRRMTWKTGSGE